MKVRALLVGVLLAAAVGCGSGSGGSNDLDPPPGALKKDGQTRPTSPKGSWPGTKKPKELRE